MIALGEHLLYESHAGRLRKDIRKPTKAAGVLHEKICAAKAADAGIPPFALGGSEAEARIEPDTLNSLAALSRAPKSGMQSRASLAKEYTNARD